MGEDGNTCGNGTKRSSKCTGDAIALLCCNFGGTIASTILFDLEEYLYLAFCRRMGIHVLLQFFVLIFVINPLCIALLYDTSGGLRLGRSNAVFLFVITLTQYPYFKKQSLIAGRVLFTPAVFFLLAISVGMTVLFFVQSGFGGVASGMIQRIIAIGSGMFFYVMSAALFGLYEASSIWQVPTIRFLGGFLVVGLFVGALSFITTAITTTNRETSRPARALTTTRTGVATVSKTIGLGRKNTKNTVNQERKRIFAVTSPAALQLSETEREKLVALLQTGNGSGEQEELVNETGDIRDDPITDLLIIPSTGTVDEPVPEDDALTEAAGSGREIGEGEVPSGRVFSVERSDTPLTYGSFLPVLVEQYALTAPANAQYSFTTISSADSRYESFRIARYRTMIGTSTSPDTQMRCGNLMVLIGLADNRLVLPGDVIQSYRQKAIDMGYTAYGCESPDTLATRIMLP